MVIMSGNTRLAETAVLASCWFQEEACAATVSRIEDNMVIRITFHFLAIICPGDERLSDNALV